jgi:hypothetical protein
MLYCEKFFPHSGRAHEPSPRHPVCRPSARKGALVTATATTALALGIGMNAMVFTLVNSFLFGRLPFEDPDRVMYVGERDDVTGRPFMVSWPDLQDWRAAQKSFVGLGAWSPDCARSDQRATWRIAAQPEGRMTSSKAAHFLASWLV